jgi:hypothetical protein
VEDQGTPRPFREIDLAPWAKPRDAVNNGSGEEDGYPLSPALFAHPKSGGPSLSERAAFGKDVPDQVQKSYVKLICAAWDIV